LEFVLRKPLGRLAIAVLASIAIPLAVAPVALASAPALATSSAAKSFKDNAATGIDLPNGFGLLRIASATGLPSQIKSAHFDVVEKAFQAEEDGRYWDVKVKLKDGHSFKKGDVKASWHCPGHTPPKSTSKTPKPPKPPVPPVEDTKPPVPPVEDTKPPVPPVEETTKPAEPSSEVPVTSPTKPAPGGGDVVDCPVKPAPAPEKPAGGTAPATKPVAQVPFAPVGGVETGFGFLAG
jgi:hypothetical protein